MKYYVDYRTGAGNFISDKSLEETKKEAADGMAFTQEHVVIYEVGDDFDIERPDTGNLRAKQVAISYFTLTKYGELYDGESLAYFGKSYCYTAWQHF